MADTNILKKQVDTKPTRRIVLFGDSLLANGKLPLEQQRLAAQLTALSPEDWCAESRAGDEHHVADVTAALARPLPPDTRYLVLAAGGHDALALEPLAFARPPSGAELLKQFATARNQFREAYGAMLDAALAHKLPAMVCTTVLSHPSNKAMQRIMSVVAGVFNDVAVGCAQTRGLPVLELRAVLASPLDFLDYLAPKSDAAPRMARAILKVLYAHDFKAKNCTIYSLKR